MAEKKIFKTEQRKLDAANKREFIGKVFQTALNALAENTVDEMDARKALARLKLKMRKKEQG